MTAPIMPERAGTDLARDDEDGFFVPTMPVINLPCRGGFGLSLWHGQVMTPGRWTMVEILDLVSEAYGISTGELKGAARTKDIAHPRQHAMWLMTRQSHLSLPQIGRFFGRDHTTILWGARRHAARLAAEWSGREAA